MLVRPDSAERWNDARRLIEEYSRALGVDLCFQNFQNEIESLATEYGSPGGCFFLAEENGEFVGCGGLRRRSPAVAEMKRVYVRPSHEGRGLGRAIVEALIAEGRALGYEAIVLDTLPTMTRAQALYRTLGFAQTGAYRYNPVAGTTYLELKLR